MTVIDFIAKHLDPNNLKEGFVKEGIDAVCSFTGRRITKGVPNKKLIKSTFTDHDYLKHSSEYSSVEAAMCIESVYPAPKGLNALRNYSYLVTENELIVLARNEVLKHILEPPKGLFVLCVTYSNKKHTAFKAKLNGNRDVFWVVTDVGNVLVDRSKVVKILEVAEKWYTVVEGKEGSKAQPTYFTKADILNGCSNMKKIKEYGVDKYFEENSILQEFRDTDYLQLIVHALNKVVNA